MKYVIGLVALLYVSAVHTEELNLARSYIICSCGEPAYFIFQYEEGKWSIHGYKKELYTKEEHEKVTWMCNQRLSKINNVFIMKTEKYVTHKCLTKI